MHLTSLINVNIDNEGTNGIKIVLPPRGTTTATTITTTTTGVVVVVVVVDGGRPAIV